MTLLPASGDGSALCEQVPVSERVVSYGQAAGDHQQRAVIAIWSLKLSWLAGVPYVILLFWILEFPIARS